MAKVAVRRLGMAPCTMADYRAQTKPVTKTTPKNKPTETTIKPAEEPANKPEGE